MARSAPAVLDRFESSLADLDVALTRTPRASFESAVRDAVAEPAVGTPLPFEGVSLPAFVDRAPTPATLRAAKTGVTAATLAIADYGSVVLPSTREGSEQVSLVPERHVAIVDETDVVPDMPTAIERLGPQLRDGDSVVIATGPSATADMGALVRGAHGPKAVHVVLLEDGARGDAGEQPPAGSDGGGDPP